MRNRKPTLGLLKKDLDRAARTLDQATHNVRDLELERARNIRKIGEALAAVFEVQHDIFRRRPDLLPKELYNTALGREVLSNRAAHPEPLKRRTLSHSSYRRPGGRER